MPYIYGDEDNYPMNEVMWEEERRERAEQKRKTALNGLLDMLKLEGGCRKCPHIIETAEGFLDKGNICMEQMDYLHILCVICGGKDGKPKREDRLDKDWRERSEWVKEMGMRHSCIYCPNVYRVYGMYKDPDDEWKAMEDRCEYCRYWGCD